MATKTITIDLEAYEALKRRKRKGQSFSDVIKDHFSTGATGNEFRRALIELRLDASTLDLLDDLVRRRGSDPARVPEL
ncbi:MAG: antitoxin VapB family protein [Gemmatimonadota bacterium]